jgi:hypothetical protein
VCIGGIRSSIRATRAMHVAPLLGKCVGWRCVRRGYLPATPSWGPPPPALLNDTTTQCGCWKMQSEQPPVLLFPVLARQLLWRRFDDSATTWVSGSSFFYLRRRHQQHPSVVETFLLPWLYRPTLHRRYARSVHPGARVFDAPANTPRRQNRPPLRLSRRSCLLFRSQDLDVTWSSLEDLYVLWLL